MPEATMPDIIKITAQDITTTADGVIHITIPEPKKDSILARISKGIFKKKGVSH